MDTEKNSLKFQPFGKFLEKRPEEFTKLYRSVSFLPVSDSFKNIDVLYRMFPAIEQYGDVFEGDVSKDEDYNAWLDGVLQFIKDAAPWFFIVLVNKKPQGAMWASAWESFGGVTHAAEIGGLAARGVNPAISLITLYKFTDRVFQDTDVRIIRAEYSEGNRAVSFCLRRCGYSHPEPRRCLRVRRGEEINGQYLSLTRAEWEVLHEQQEKREKGPSATEIHAV